MATTEQILPTMRRAVPQIYMCDDTSLAYTGVNRHTTDTRIGLMDSSVPIEAIHDRRTVSQGCGKP